MDPILFVFPTLWDRRQLEACEPAWRGRYRPVFDTPDDMECPWDFDVIAYIEETARRVRGSVRGVTSSSDYPGATVAGALASRLGLPGTPPERVMRCSHKYYSRIAQREAAPGAVPPFSLVRPFEPVSSQEGLFFPCFIKPVKGAFSVMSQRLDTPAEMEAFLARPAVREFMEDYVAIFNRLVAKLTDFDVDGSWFLTEGLLHGGQASVEGFVHDGEVRVVGVVDSVLQPETGSFIRFDYPSRIAPAAQERMVEVVSRVIRRLGLRETFFNAEMVVDPAGERVSILEINPRICGQFADLYQMVDGTNTYEVMLDLAAGREPAFARGRGKFAVASSFPLRVFEPVEVLHAPSSEEVREVEARLGPVRVWLECRTGDALSDFETLEDGASYRYGILNAGGVDWPDLEARAEAARRELGFRFRSLSPGGGPADPAG